MKPRRLQLAWLLASALLLSNLTAQAEPGEVHRVMDEQGLIDDWPASTLPLVELSTPGLVLTQRIDTLELGLYQRGQAWRSLRHRGHLDNLYSGGTPKQLLDQNREATPLLWPHGVWSSQNYLSPIHRMHGEFFLAARKPGDRYDVLHATGKALMTGITQEQAMQLEGFGNNILERRMGQPWVHALHDSPRRLGSDVHRKERIGSHIVLFDARQKVTGVIPLSGHGLRTHLRWRHATRVSSADDHLWLHDEHHNALAILKEDGQDLITPDVLRRLGGLRLQSPEERASVEADGSPIVALVVSEICPCGNAGVQGVLLKNGQILFNSKWTTVRWLGSVAVKPDTSHARSDRFAVQVNESWLMIDERGRVLTPQGYDVIQSMESGWAVASKDGRFYLLDGDGKSRLLPDFLEVRVLGENLLAYQSLDGAPNRWGLYAIREQTIHQPPSWRQINTFWFGRSVVSDAQGLKGLIDEQGHAVLPTHFEKLWLVSKSLWAGTRHAQGDAQWMLMNASGVTLESNLPIEPEPRAGWVHIPHIQSGEINETVFYHAQDGRRLALPGRWVPERVGNLLLISSRTARAAP